MMFTVADRFGFTLSEIEGMTRKKLEYWYGGAIKLYKKERGGRAE